MASVRALTMLVVLAGTVGGCDMFEGKSEQAATCAMAPASATAAPVAAGAAPAAGQKPAPVDQASITQRSVSTIVEQMSFQLCTARINRWIDDEYYRTEMTALRKASFSALGVSVPEPAAPAAAADQSPAAPEEANAL